jgi:acetate kinase
MSSAILVLNAGSSSLKFSVYDIVGDNESLQLFFHGQISGIGERPQFYLCDSESGEEIKENISVDNDTFNHKDALGLIFDWIQHHYQGLKVVAAGHRVVHGGNEYTYPVIVDADVLRELKLLCPLAPLHQPHNLSAISMLKEIQPRLLHVACFDTAFHHTIPRIGRLYALPRLYSDQGLVQYGFHGLSYEYIAGVLPDYLGSEAEGRTIVAHLGNGASMCAMLGRESVATTMGFTPLDGLPMGTRCGAIDPGVLLYLLTEKRMRVSELTDVLQHQSGLFGVSGISNDVRVLLASENPFAEEAINLFVYRAGKELGSLAAVLGGLDTLVFTAGIGEHAVVIRERICQLASWLGVELDETRNQNNAEKISTDNSPVSVWIIPTDEELMIAQHVHNILYE